MYTLRLEPILSIVLSQVSSIDSSSQSDTKAHLLHFNSAYEVNNVTVLTIFIDPI